MIANFRILGVGGTIARSLALALAVPALGLPGAIYAQGNMSLPTPRQQEMPEQPTNQFRMPMQGWVKIRYSVLADGTTDNVRAIDTVPPHLPNKGAIKAVEEWTFEPAMVDGKPSDWHNNESIVVFGDLNSEIEPSQRFGQSYVRGLQLVEAQELKEARETNERLVRMAATLQEIGIAQAQAAIVEVASGNIHDAYTAIRRATEPDVATLGPKELAEALKYRYAIERQLGRAADVVTTFTRLQSLQAVPGDDPLAIQTAAIQKALADTDAAIVVSARVGEDPWVHVPARRTFSISDVDGTVREIQVECDRRSTVLEFMPDVDWTLPAGWGACTLLVDARRDTTFSLYEFK